MGDVSLTYQTAASAGCAGNRQNRKKPPKAAAKPLKPIPAGRSEFRHKGLIIPLRTCAHPTLQVYMIQRVGVNKKDCDLDHNGMRIAALRPFQCAGSASVYAASRSRTNCRTCFSKKRLTVSHNTPRPMKTGSGESSAS